LSLSIETKKAVVEEIVAGIGNAQTMVLAEYRGISVASMTELRANARKEGVYLRVLKNTLARRAVEGTPFAGLAEHMVGPLVYAASEDAVAAAKVLHQFSKKDEKLIIKAGSYDGAVMDATQVQKLVDEGKSRSELKSLVKTAQERVNTALKQAQELVESLSQKLAALEAGTFDNNVHYSATIKSRPTLPPADASPQEVASWWSSLSDEDKQWMIHEHPDVIGNLEGVDYTSRNEANRIMLPRLKEQAEADLQKFYDDNGPYIEPALRSERDRLKNRVTALEQIEETLERENTENPPVPRYLMQLDASGPNILAAVSQNNPDDADHIGVIVPGMTTSVADSLGEYDGHATTLRKSAETAATSSVSVASVNHFFRGVI